MLHPLANRSGSPADILSSHYRKVTLALWRRLSHSAVPGAPPAARLSVRRSGVALLALAVVAGLALVVALALPRAAPAPAAAAAATASRKPSQLEVDEKNR